MSNHWQHESHQAKDEVQGPIQVGHAVHDADVAAGHGSVRGASPLDEGEEVEKPFEHSYGLIGRFGRLGRREQDKSAQNWCTAFLRVRIPHF